MKKFRLVLAMLALALVVGMAFVGCKSETDSPFEGTWASGSPTGTFYVKYQFLGSEFQCTYINGQYNGTYSGTFTYTGTTITFNQTAPNARIFTHEYTISSFSLILRPNDQGNFNGTFTKQ